MFNPKFYIMKQILLSIALLTYSVLSAQSGDTIDHAIDVDGTNVSVNLLDFTSATASGLLPVCNASEDVFYRHTVSSGDNKVEIGMVSSGLTLLANMDYQILLAPGGDTNAVQEVTCDSYEVFVLAGGSFDLVIDNVNPSDEYYLRVFKNTQALIDLQGLLEGTLITMTSSFDATLSIDDIEENAFDFTVTKDRINLSESANFSQYQIYGIDGRLVNSSDNLDQNNTIDITNLTKGIYILNIADERRLYSHKFIKY